MGLGEDKRRVFEKGIEFGKRFAARGHYTKDSADAEDTTPSACAGKLRRDVLGWRWSPLLASEEGSLRMRCACGADMEYRKFASLDIESKI